jgi:hypothetical protein
MSGDLLTSCSLHPITMCLLRSLWNCDIKELHNLAHLNRSYFISIPPHSWQKNLNICNVISRREASVWLLMIIAKSLNVVFTKLISKSRVTKYSILYCSIRGFEWVVLHFVVPISSYLLENLSWNVFLEHAMPQRSQDPGL